MRIGHNIDSNISSKAGLASKAYVDMRAKQIVNASQYDFYEMEAFEVKKVILSKKDIEKLCGGDWSYYGAIGGNFVSDPTKPIKSRIPYIKPSQINTKNIPVKGEYVIVAEHIGTHYYLGIINLRGSVSDNSSPGATGIPVSSTGKTYSRPDRPIRQVEVCEGEIVYNGKFGTSIKLGCDHKHNNSPIVKIRSGQRTDYDAFLKESPLRPVKEDIDKDANSIYLSTSGTYSLSNPNGNITSPNILFGERPNRNKIFNQIIMNSDKLVFNARKENIQIKAAKNVHITGDEVFIHATKGGTIKMGDPLSVFIPTVNGEKLLELFKSLVILLGSIPQAVANPKAMADVVNETKNIAQQVINKEFLNMQVMTADPNFKIPKIPDSLQRLRDLDPELEEFKLRQKIAGKVRERGTGLVNRLKKRT